MATATDKAPAPNDRSNIPFTLTRTYRGVVYTITEVSIEEFDKINEKATIKETITVAGDEREIERIDGSLQTKLMMEACVSPKPPKPCPLPIFNGLRAAVDEVNFTTEKDETPKGETNGESTSDEAEAASGNG